MHYGTKKRFRFWFKKCLIFVEYTKSDQNCKKNHFKFKFSFEKYLKFIKKVQGFLVIATMRFKFRTVKNNSFFFKHQILKKILHKLGSILL